MYRFQLIVIGLAGLWLVACSQSSSASNDLYQISLLPDPAGYPGEVMRVRVEEEPGVPVTDATVSIEGNMNHAGMVPVMTEGVQDEADGTADGVYAVPFALTMLGDWIITVKVTPPDGPSVEHNIDLTATEDSITVDP